MLPRLYFYASKQQKCWCTFVRFMLLQKAKKRCRQRDLNTVNIIIIDKNSYLRYNLITMIKESEKSE